MALCEMCALQKLTIVHHAVLTNDHKRVTSQIERLMHELHAEARKAPSADTVKRPRMAEADITSIMPLHTSPNAAAAPPMRPFAVVDEVSSSSPAEEAGVAVGDQLIAFASITGQTPNTLPAVAAALQVKHKLHKALSTKDLVRVSYFELIIE